MSGAGSSEEGTLTWREASAEKFQSRLIKNLIGEEKSGGEMTMRT